MSSAWNEYEKTKDEMKITMENFSMKGMLFMFPPYTQIFILSVGSIINIGLDTSGVKNLLTFFPSPDKQEKHSDRSLKPTGMFRFKRLFGKTSPNSAFGVDVFQKRLRLRIHQGDFWR